ncbi:UPF0280 family protein [Agrobacterium sp. SHOUNA12C]|uniref:Uncharacterized protein n=1 Tax=Rhizobium rhizogenes NBRC 13257 TaxID=1220581 RepID=A0AA87U4I5_RHIRH|nr:UPF0280 family protein [Rhizobium rhizogenes]MCJ9720554.1 UPF0280 family protein [Agrobacterium sp. BETTINA12B]MCJ9758107.1 UPF0280 family protein [Agrobacterium sp. SHOUNA12C]NTF51454.1 UPF0280 family protein [Rhizobium rhizogenes]NTF57988.1 UPF0280 family protein [Rhizobium rhizogenes]NTF64407.1 UPF0280 family protein [Rhizobium rhizogenes]
MSRPVARYLDGGDPNGRLHLQHGPIDLVIGVDDGGAARIGEAERRAHAFAAAIARFQTVLDELVSELPQLRAPAEIGSAMPTGSVARRMVAAVRPFVADHFITPMAAVAGAVGDEILAAMLAAFDKDDRPLRAYVNNGGDIAVHLEDDAEYRVRMAREDGTSLGDFALHASSPTRGIATSGRGGRSLSMGIADSVTVLATNAAAADAAVTLVANAVDLPGHTAISRARAVDVVDDSDLGERLVVTGCGPLTDAETDMALSRGLAKAERFIALGLIDRAGLFLANQGLLAMPPAAKPLTATPLSIDQSMERFSNA